MNPPTPRQASALRILSDRAGSPPSLRELGQALGLTVQGAWDLLRRCERRGYVQRGAARQGRAIGLTGLGRMVAGGLWLEPPHRCACGAERYGGGKCPICRRAGATVARQRSSGIGRAA